ncbi:hypothetical protein EMEDMD4_180068 [Sinorhizobium medicae]|uniref:Uncharacterized protein n=1 Tax=Sinorhizobium medicae TaxID=110321 RepID=A0A508WT42_9HYPH|nr:hypothetical protein EMEDMD4_180068 [Sinorhizobium medicae]
MQRHEIQGPRLGPKFRPSMLCLAGSQCYRALDFSHGGHRADVPQSYEAYQWQRSRSPIRSSNSTATR